MNIPNNKIAHRVVFNNTSIPENSMKAFQKAIDLNYSIELDIQFTKDFVLVVFHDDNLKRMTGVNKNVCDLEYNEIKKLKLLDTNERIPTLQEVLKLVKGKVLLDIEIKTTKYVTRICNQFYDEINNYSNFIVKSFNPKIVRKIKKDHPEWDVGYLIQKKYPTSFYNIFLPSKFMIHYSKANFLAIDKKLLKSSKFIKLKKKYPLFIWTVKKNDHYSNEEYVLICNDLCEK